MGKDDFDADAICAAVERMDGQMTALALNELPKDDYYGGGDGNENSDEEQGETAAKEAPGLARPLARDTSISFRLVVCAVAVGSAGSARR